MPVAVLRMPLGNSKGRRMTKVYDRVALVGLGLIASSMYWAIKRAGLAGEVTGFARSAETRDTARRIGLCDRVCDSVQDAVRDADLVVLCVPCWGNGISCTGYRARFKIWCNHQRCGIGETVRD
jgi:threonine dehydrogenase-like Zn-dependent dehydrogenase